MKNKNTKNINKRLEEIRKAIQNESVSTSELIELESLQKYINPNDIELLEWAGVGENSAQTKTRGMLKTITGNGSK